MIEEAVTVPPLAEKNRVVETPQRVRCARRVNQPAQPRTQPPRRTRIAFPAVRRVAVADEDRLRRIARQRRHREIRGPCPPAMAEDRVGGKLRDESPVAPHLILRIAGSARQAKRRDANAAGVAVRARFIRARGDRHFMAARGQFARLCRHDLGHAIGLRRKSESREQQAHAARFVDGYACVRRKKRPAISARSGAGRPSVQK